MLTHNEVRRGIAVHEAGHAVAGVALGYAVDHAVILRPSRGEGVGHCLFVVDFRLWPKPDGLAMLAAGDAAVLRWRPDGPDEFRPYLRRLSNRSAAAHARRCAAVNVPVLTIDRGDAGDAMDIVDPQVPGQFTEAIEQADRTAIMLVDCHWRAVEAVADELVRCRRADGVRVAELCHAAGVPRVGVHSLPPGRSPANPVAFAAVCGMAADLVELRRSGPTATAAACMLDVARALAAGSPVPPAFVEMAGRFPPGRDADEDADTLRSFGRELAAGVLSAPLPPPVDAEPTPDRPGDDPPAPNPLLLPALFWTAAELVDLTTPATVSAAYATLTEAARRLLWPREVPGAFYVRVRNLRRDAGPATSPADVAVQFRATAAAGVAAAFGIDGIDGDAE